MDAAKKVTTEKYIFAGLVVVFVIAFVKGPLKSLGLVGHTPPVSVATSVKGGDLSVPVALGKLMQDRRKVANQQPEVDGERAPETRSLLAKAYTAHDLRDPFKHLFPKLDAPPEIEHEAAPAPSSLDAAPLPPESPPKLRIQGQLWGGPKPEVIIDDRVYGINDVVEGVKILAIDQGGVTIEHNGKPVRYSP